MSDQTTPEPAGAPPEAPPSTPLRRRRALPLIIAGAVAVVLVVAAVGGYVFFRPHLSGEYPASLDTPPEVAGLELSTDPALAEAAAQMSASLTEDVEVDEVLAAFYTDPAAAERLVMLTGGTALLRDPEAELDAAFRGANDGGLELTGTTDVDAGQMGGTARCDEATIEGIATVVCGWADHGSLVLALFFNRTLDDSATLLPEIRAAVLTR